MHVSVPCKVLLGGVSATTYVSTNDLPLLYRQYVQALVSAIRPEYLGSRRRRISFASRSLRPSTPRWSR
jgi:hypothetical protein